MCRDDGAANPIRTSKAFWRKAIEEGVQYELGNQATEIEHTNDLWRVRVGGDNFEAPVLVNCAGAWGDQIAAMMGDYAPLSVEALTMMVTSKMERFIKPVCGLASGGLSFKQSEEGTLLIGGGHQGIPNRDQEIAEVDASSMAASATIVSRVFPQLKEIKVARAWCGLEGKMPDEIPVIGASENAKDAYHAFGFCGHGFQLSPIVGRLIAEEIVDGKSSLPIETFSISRFSKTKNGISLSN